MCSPTFGPFGSVSPGAAPATVTGNSSASAPHADLSREDNPTSKHLCNTSFSRVARQSCQSLPIRARPGHDIWMTLLDPAARGRETHGMNAYDLLGVTR